MPSELRYAKSHEWVCVEGEIAVVGITDCAQDALGNIEFVELPAKGTIVEQNGEMALVESTKVACDVLAPIPGTVFQVNKALERFPALINRAPYTDGWLCRLKPFDPAGLASLMTAEEYEAHIGR